MLELGLPAVAVGGSEPALIERVKDLDHVHCAKGMGVAGIAEAIFEHGLSPGGSLRSSRMSSDLVIVYHRQPYEESCRGTAKS
jgi:hypothetical protein